MASPQKRSKLYTIYFLIDPRDGEIRYVGATRNPLQVRLIGHVNDALHHPLGSPRKNYWIKDLLAQGLKPEIEKFFTCKSPKEVSQREAIWIRRLRSSGCDLLNAPSGAAYYYPKWIYDREVRERFEAACGVSS